MKRRGLNSPVVRPVADRVLMASVSDIAKIIEEWAPPPTAQSYDNVGLQVGRAERSVSRVIVALDLTPEVVDEAIRKNADLIITHHPLLFRPLKSLTGGDFVSELALRLAEAGIALYAAHTNDAARDGSSVCAGVLVGPAWRRVPTQLDDSLCKLVTFVPESHELLVREAIAAAGGGRIGNYDSCAFGMKGVGYFRAGEGAKPAVGAADGTVQSVEEVRIEAEVPTWRVAPMTIAALRSAHPYEEVAYDLYPQNRRYPGAGLGAIGDLPAAMTVAGFLAHVAAALNADALRFSGPDEAEYFAGRRLWRRGS